MPTCLKCSHYHGRSKTWAPRGTYSLNFFVPSDVFQLLIVSAAESYPASPIGPSLSIKLDGLHLHCHLMRV